jgi:bleomycin hydrolase
MYVVYWEYVARAEYFVEHRGDMYFGEGSETNAVLKISKKHGLVPTDQYTGMLKGQRFHNHSKMANEIESYLNYVKTNNLWDKPAVVANVKSILNHYMTEPPSSVKVKDKEMNPQEYMREITKLNPDDYFCFMSTISKTYNQKGELEEPDNWWHNDDYYNLQLDDFISVLTFALNNGYTVSICGDVSEPGYDRYAEVGIIPDFDIPQKYINADSREFRINNGSSTDDHCIHLVGFTKKDGQYWFMIKDSSASGFDGLNKGYRFIREDYARLKILAIMVHKYGAKNVLDGIIK